MAWLSGVWMVQVESRIPALLFTLSRHVPLIVTGRETESSLFRDGSVSPLFKTFFYWFQLPILWKVEVSRSGASKQVAFLICLKCYAPKKGIQLYQFPINWFKHENTRFCQSKKKPTFSISRKRESKKVGKKGISFYTFSSSRSAEQPKSTPL